MIRVLAAIGVAVCLATAGEARSQDPAPRGANRHFGDSTAIGTRWNSWSTASGGIGSWTGQPYRSPGDMPAGGYYFRAGSSYYLPYDYFGAVADYGVFSGAPLILAPYQPEIYQPLPAGDPQLQQLIQENQGAGVEPAVTFPVEELPQRFIPPSTAAAKVRSIRALHEGDLQVRNLQFAMAARRYREALTAAEDRPEPYFRLAFAEAAIGDFSEAVRLYKLGLQLDPGWPDHGPTLNELMGEGNLLAKTQVKQRVADWTLENARDPDRLFLLGVLLHKDGDADKARLLFETATALVGRKPYLTAFLSSGSVPGVARDGAVPPKAAGDLPPPPAPDGAGLAPPEVEAPNRALPGEPPIPPPPADP
jgi:tetratricopeptide (TPR) repeat protein